jgi:hypothetical protein
MQSFVPRIQQMFTVSFCVVQIRSKIYLIMYNLQKHIDLSYVYAAKEHIFTKRLPWIHSLIYHIQQKRLNKSDTFALQQRAVVFKGILLQNRIKLDNWTQDQ